MAIKAILEAYSGNKTVFHVAGAIVLAASIGYAAGRYFVPAKVTTKTEIKEVEKIVEKRVEVEKKTRKNDKTTIIVEITKPDGTKEKRTMIVDKGETNIDLSKDFSSERETKKDVSSETVVDTTKNWQANGLVGINIDTKTEIYGLQVERRLFGPLKVGVFGMTNKTVGASIGVEF